MGLQIVRDWVERFNARGPDGLLDGKAPDKLDVPANLSIIALPPKCPELNPVENIWQFMRDNWLSNRVFTSHDSISTIAAKPGTNS